MSDGVTPRVLVRSLWQTVNIGDVAHAPGTLRAFERFWPDAELVLWPIALEARERDLLRRFLPGVRVVEGELGGDGTPSTTELADAFDSSDVLVHGPAANLRAESDLRAWRRATGKPYGFFGVTVDPLWPTGGTLRGLEFRVRGLPPGTLPTATRDVLDGAAFVFCRDAVTLGYLKAQGVAPAALEFGPDATFAFDLHDGPAADRIVAEHGLTDGEFVCVVPRLRHTPYHQIFQREPDAEDLRRVAVSAAHVAGDLGLLRDLVTGWVRDTGRDVLACPEMTYEIELCRDELVAKLPPDVAPKVKLVSQFWGPHEAAAVYARAHSVVSQECHSPILAVAAGTPALYVRNPTDSVKGQMYAELGLAEELFEVEETGADELLAALQADRGKAVDRAVRARALAHERLAHMVGVASGSVMSARHGRGST